MKIAELAEINALKNNHVKMEAVNAKILLLNAMENV
jgi:hypothetical protein